MPVNLDLIMFAFIIVAPITALSFSTRSSTMTVAPGHRLRPYDPTRESDRSSLEKICANVYGGGDYLPKVASTYAADPACSFLALTKKKSVGDDDDGASSSKAAGEEEGDEDEIIAVANYKRLPSQRSAWIEAVRTHPDHRNKGLASALLRSLVDLSKQERDVVQNLLTCTVRSNKGMLRALGKVGFEQRNTIQTLSFGQLTKLPGWKSDCDQLPQPLLDALDLKHLVSPTAKGIASSPYWHTISSEQELLDRLQLCRMEGGCGYLPGLYEYIVPGPNRIDLKHSMEQGLVLALDVPFQKEKSSCVTGAANGDVEEGEGGQAIVAIVALTRDERISSLKSKWVCSIVACTPLAFEAALWHAQSLDVATRMVSYQQGDSEGNDALNAENETISPSPFCLVFDDAVPRTPGTLAHALPRVETADECVVLSYCV